MPMEAEPRVLGSLTLGIAESWILARFWAI